MLLLTSDQAFSSSCESVYTSRQAVAVAKLFARGKMKGLLHAFVFLRLRILTMTRRSPFSRRIAKSYRAQRPLFQLAFIGLAAAVVIAGIFLGVQVLKSDPRTISPVAADKEPAEEAVPPAAREYALAVPPGASPSLAEVVGQIFVAYGGKEAIGQMRAVRRLGTARSGAAENTLGIHYFWRAAGQMRYSVYLEETEQLLIVNRDTVWRGLLREDQLLDSRVLSGPQQERFRRNLAMSGPAPRALLEADRLSLQPPETVNGRLCFVILRRHEGFTEKLSFDQDNFLCLRRSRDDRDLHDDWGSTRIDYDDFRQVGDVVVPFAQTTSVDREPPLRFQTDQFELNPGLFSDFFRPPPEFDNERNSAG